MGKETVFALRTFRSSSVEILKKGAIRKLQRKNVPRHTQVSAALVSLQWCRALLIALAESQSSKTSCRRVWKATKPLDCLFSSPRLRECVTLGQCRATESNEANACVCQKKPKLMCSACLQSTGCLHETILVICMYMLPRHWWEERTMDS